jgi:hypothetical protein
MQFSQDLSESLMQRVRDFVRLEPATSYGGHSHAVLRMGQNWHPCTAGVKPKEAKEKQERIIRLVGNFLFNEVVPALGLDLPLPRGLQERRTSPQLVRPDLGRRETDHVVVLPVTN